MQFLRCTRQRGRSYSSNHLAGAWVEGLERRVLLSADVLTYHNDQGRTGQDLNETTLTPQNVNSADFGLLFSDPVDGYVFAQPLYVSNLAIPGQGTRDVVFVATEHDSVYAFDADSNSGGNSQPLWHDSFVNPAAGVTTVPAADTQTGDIAPEVGITGTPVIDLSTNTLYVVSNTKATNPTTHAVSYAQQLHALDITTGVEKFGGPVNIQFSVHGTGTGSQNGLNTFNPLIESERAGLALADGNIYITWASHGDVGPYHGFVAAYNAANLQLESVLNLSPGGDRAGVWESGGAPAIDSQGNIFLTVGNGTFDNGNGDWGDSVLRITNTSGLAVADSFTPFNQAALDQADIDFGSGGVMLLPTQAGPDPDEAISGGKDGNLYLVNADNLGGFNATGNGNLQTIAVGKPGAGIYDTPAYYNGSVYVNAESHGVESFPVVNGQLTGPASAQSNGFSFPGATPSISANGNQDGIVWEIEYAASSILRAFDASNVADELYNNLQSGTRDLIGQGVKFAVPTVADGHVFVGTGASVAVFGLLSSSTTAPPTAPSNLIATPLSPTDIQLTWQQNSTNATSFQIDRSTDGVNFTQIGSAAGSSTRFDDLTVDVGNTYTYKVEAGNSAGTSAASNPAIATAPAVPGLVGYWQFNEGVGTTTADASGAGDTGTLSGEVTWIPGRIGPAALNFHGAGVQDAHVAIPNEPQLQFTATDSFTLGVWVQPNALQGKWAGIVTKSTDAAPSYGLYLDPSNHWAFATSSGDNVIEGPLADTGWHYLTLVQDGSAGTRSLYVDGTLAASGSAEDGSGAGDLWVGGSKSSIQEYFNGAVDDLAIYNVALDAGQILGLSRIPATPAAGAASISGTVFEDDQLTGVQENGEASSSGVIVFLDDSGTGVLQPNEPTAITDSSGNYRFTGLADGTYRVIAVAANEEHLTTPPGGYRNITLTGGQTVTGANFGEVDNDETPVPAQFKLALTSKLPGTAITAQKGTATLRVTNTSGALFNKPLQLVLFLSTSPVLDSTAYGVASPVYSKVVLRAGQSHTFHLKFTYPSTLPAGSYYLIGSVTAEKSDGEDQFIVSSPTQVAVSPPTVTLQSAIVNPGGIRVKPGHKATANIRVSNAGNVAAAGIITISLFASADTTLDDSDTPLKTLKKRIRIRSGGSLTVGAGFVAPPGSQGGAYAVIAQVNSSTAPRDTDADDDTATALTRSS